MRDIGLQFFFLVIYVSDFGIRVLLALQNEFCSIPSAFISRKILWRIGVISYFKGIS